MKTAHFILLSVFLLSISTLPLSATTLLQMNDQRLVEASESIVIGTIVDSWVEFHERWDCPVTYARVEVEKILKGTQGRETVVIKALGGKIGDLSAEVPSSPQIDELGTRLFLFLHDDLNTFHCNIIGWEQGSLEIDDEDFLEAKNMSLEKYTRKISAIVEIEKEIDRNPFAE
jgi:hypothetical protein